MNLDAFALIAELSLGLLGFSGVAASFGGRERSFNYVERIRFVGVVGHASIPLFGCLMVYVLSAAEVAPDSLVICAAAFSLTLFVPYSALAIPNVIRSRHDTATSTEKWAVAIVWIQALLGISLYALSILYGGVVWALVAAYSAHLAMGVFVFWRILMRPE